jgi:hypothetical protein
MDLSGPGIVKSCIVHQMGRSKQFATPLHYVTLVGIVMTFYKTSSNRITSEFQPQFPSVFSRDAGIVS